MESARKPDRPYTGLDLRLANLAKFLIRHRRSAMVLQVMIFVACILATLSLRLHDDPNAWPPRSDRSCSSTIASRSSSAAATRSASRCVLITAPIYTCRT